MDDTYDSRRSNPRFLKRIPVLYTIGAEEFESHTINISKYGLFISSKEPEPVGTTVKIEMNLPDSFGEVVGTARVVWSRKTDNEHSGMGVIFLSMFDDSKNNLEEYIEMLTVS